MGPCVGQKSEVGDIGLERKQVLPTKTADTEPECAHLCAVGEIPAFLRESGRVAAWDDLPENFRRRIASLPPDVLAALHALFSGLDREQAAVWAVQSGVV